MPQHAMVRQAVACALFDDQLAPAQPFEGGLDGAFGKAGCFRKHPQAGADRLPFRRSAAR